MFAIINSKNYVVNNMDTFYKRLKGLMFVKRSIKEIYYFPNCASIHTYFMKQNIDVCIIDKNNKIIYLKENVKPKKIIIKNGGKHTLEMPLGICKHLKIGDTLIIKD